MKMIEDIPAYLQLTEHIATSGQPGEAQLADVAQAGFQVVINLALAGMDYSLPDEAGVVRRLGMEYIHIPVNWNEPTRRNLEDFFVAMDANQGVRTYVHCAANMRVSVFMALYRIKRLGWQPEQAFNEMLKIWRPEGIWAAFIHKMLES